MLARENTDSAQAAEAHQFFQSLLSHGKSTSQFSSEKVFFRQQCSKTGIAKGDKLRQEILLWLVQVATRCQISDQAYF